MNVIKAENISKKYRIGVINSDSLKEDIDKLWKKITNSNSSITIPDNEINFIWALKNINFSIAQGESIGFVGKNGAGKSTLFKILSRVTLPTTGCVKGNGKLASLLEVGTGFHPELTGKENIFLNGQILGMKKEEIIQKFDEIISFSGIGKFIDTPVKRYSTGMYLRLSFAVAAHLDADILLVDEALAVGDAEFQAKCVERMKYITQSVGKTVLFVSHNMQSVRDLCSRAIYLKEGQIIDDGKPSEIIEHYLHKEKVQFLKQEYQEPKVAPGNKYIRIKKIELIPQNSINGIFDITSSFEFVFEFWNFLNLNLKVGIHLYDFSGTCIFDLQSENIYIENRLVKGSCTIPANFIISGSYYISIDFIKDNTELLYLFNKCVSFDIQNSIEGNTWFNKWNGFLKPNFEVKLETTVFD